MKLIQICLARRIVFLILLLTLGAWLSETCLQLENRKADLEKSPDLFFFFAKSKTSQKCF